jgi:hypothetical protein
MVDHVLDLKRTPFILADRNVTTIQLQVLGAIRDSIRIGMAKGVDVRSDGSVIVNISPDMASKIAHELLNLARKGRFNGKQNS